MSELAKQVEPRELDAQLWDGALEHAPLVFVDLEMTGCDPARDRICEIAIERRVGGLTVASFESLVNPGVTVGRSAEVHGLQDALLSGAPQLRELRSVIDPLLEGAILVGHAIDFDLSFLDAAAEAGELAAVARPALDTKKLAQRALRQGSTSLAALADDLGLPAPTHRAAADVRATVALLEQVIAALRPGTARHLLQAQDVGGPARLRDDIAEVLSHAWRTRTTVQVRYRVPGREPFDDELAIWALEFPRVEGWLTQRGQLRALRGDRILRVCRAGRPYAIPEDFRPTIPRAVPND